MELFAEYNECRRVGGTVFPSLYHWKEEVKPTKRNRQSFNRKECFMAAWRLSTS